VARVVEEIAIEKDEGGTRGSRCREISYQWTRLDDDGGS
jgi:hypothetical protein